MFRATTESVYRLSPGRDWGSYCGTGLPVPQNGEPRGGIVGAGLPYAAAACFPGVVLVLPGFAAGIAGLGHHVPAPELLAGSGVERRDPSACAGIPAPLATRTLSSTVIGAVKNLSRVPNSLVAATILSQTISPLSRLMAITRPSGRLAKTRSSQKAMPRVRARCPGASRRDRSPRRTGRGWGRARQFCRPCPSRPWCT